MPITANQHAPADEDRPAPQRVTPRDAGRDRRAGRGIGGRRLALVASGPLAKIQTAGGALEGVAAFPDPSGHGYGIDLWLRAEAVELHALGDRVRDAVGHAARDAGLGDALGAIAVHIVDIDLEGLHA